MSEIPFSFSYMSADCMKRLRSAVAIKPAKIQLNRERCSAYIEGSHGDIYETNLDGCDCVDFAMQHKPCKHMIRLAIELGYEFENPIFDTCKASSYDIQNDIQHFYELWMDGIIHQDVYIDCIVALDKNAQRAGKKK